MPIDSHMHEENEMDGYAKIDQYNPVLVKQIASDYEDIIRRIGEQPERGLQAPARRPVEGQAATCDARLRPG